MSPIGKVSIKISLWNVSFKAVFYSKSYVKSVKTILESLIFMAKLQFNQLDAHLNQSIASVYLVSGDEVLLVEESCNAIRTAAQKKGCQQRERFVVDANFDWAQFLTSAMTRSLFSKKKLIELHFIKASWGAQGVKMLTRYLDTINQDCCLVIVMPKLAPAQQRSQWCKRIEKVGVWLPIWPVRAEDLPKWLSLRFQQAGLNVHSEALHWLCARVQGNLLAAKQEIEKLKIFSNGELITVDILQACVEDSARFDVFELIDAALAGDAHASLRYLRGLRREGQEPVVILWAITRELRILMAIVAKVELGANFLAAMNAAGVWKKRHSIVREAADRLQLRQLAVLMRQANGIDKAIKGLRQSDPWRELEELLLGVCGQFVLNVKTVKISLQR